MGIDTKRGGYNPDDELKKKLSEEGFEGDEEGGAAVLVGKKEDMERKRQLLETEGRTANLSTYLRLHKEIALPADRVPENDLKPGSAKCIYPGFNQDQGTIFLKFKDKDGNIAHVHIDTFKIAQLDGLTRSQAIYNVDSQLKVLGFKIDEYKGFDSNWERIDGAQHLYQDELKKKDEKGKSLEFDF